MKRKLTDTAARNAKMTPDGKPKKHTDGGGLYLLVNAKGKYWRYDYQYMDKRKTLSLGTYPELNLAAARDKHNEARELLKRHIDPSQHKKVLKITQSSGNSFETVAREWFARFSPDWSETHSERIISYLQRDVFPFIGERIIGEIEPPELVPILNRIVDRGAKDAAKRVRQFISQVFRYAIATGRATRNQAEDLKGMLPKTRKRNFAAITDPIEAGALMRGINDYRGSFVTRCALQLSAMFMLRPGELRKAEWSEFDFEQKLWIIPIKRMKAATDVKRENKQVHIVPLSSQAISILQELHQLTGRRGYVFPGIRTPTRPMSENTVNVALRRMGYTNDEMTAHGFRAMASSLLNEMKRPDGSRRFSEDAIERQLSHRHKDPIRGVYDRSSQLSERIDMMQVWSDYLGTLRDGAQVLPFKPSAKQA